MELPVVLGIEFFLKKAHLKEIVNEDFIPWIGDENIQLQQLNNNVGRCGSKRKETGPEPNSVYRPPHMCLFPIKIFLL